MMFKHNGSDGMHYASKIVLLRLSFICDLTWLLLRKDSVHCTPMIVSLAG